MSRTQQSRPHTAHHSSSQAAPPPPIDNYYGHEDTSKICARFVSHTFQCPETIPSPLGQSSNTAVSRSGTTVGPQPPSQVPNTLAHFVAYALHRTRLHPSVVFTALALLHRLKSRFPAARGSSGHRLFLAAYMLASKVVCDDTYSNKSWAVVGQGMFALREINQMEREMLGYLEWSLNIPGEDLVKFEKEVRRIYGIGRERESWGRGVELRLLAGVGGIKPPQETSMEELPVLAIPAICGNGEKTSPQQLPTPTEAGPAVVPVPTRPALPPISTTVAKVPAYPSPPSSPTSAPAARKAMCNSNCSSASTSPVDGESEQDESDTEYDPYPYPRRPKFEQEGGDGSPSPTSSEDSATLPTPPNSALPHHRSSSHSYAGYAQKMGKSHSVPGFMYAPREAPESLDVGRSSAPPVAVPKREPVVSSVSASHFGSFSASMEEDGDTVMDLEDEKRGGMSYYTTVHRPIQRPASTAAVMASSRASASSAAKKELGPMKDRERDRGREIKEGGRRDRERSLRTYTVPCAW
ncbi:hypothetical protein ACEPAF_5576 [Sanghuangporus sanghuang]